MVAAVDLPGTVRLGLRPNRLPRPRRALGRAMKRTGLREWKRPVLTQAFSLRVPMKCGLRGPELCCRLARFQRWHPPRRPRLVLRGPGRVLARIWGGRRPSTMPSGVSPRSSKISKRFWKTWKRPWTCWTWLPSKSRRPSANWSGSTALSTSCSVPARANARAPDGESSGRAAVLLPRTSDFCTGAGCYSSGSVPACFDPRLLVLRPSAGVDLGQGCRNSAW